MKPSGHGRSVERAEDRCNELGSRRLRGGKLVAGFGFRGGAGRPILSSRRGRRKSCAALEPPAPGRESHGGMKDVNDGNGVAKPTEGNGAGRGCRLASAIAFCSVGGASNLMHAGQVPVKLARSQGRARASSFFRTPRRRSARDCLPASKRTAGVVKAVTRRSARYSPPRTRF